MNKILTIIVIFIFLFSVVPADAFVYGIPGGIGSKGEEARELRLPEVVKGDGAADAHGRIIAMVKTEQQKSAFINRGCQVVHDLEEGTAFECPGLVAQGLIRQGLAVEDKLLQLHDYESDTFINADDVWVQGITGNGVRVAILDTGVDSNHVELAGNIIAMKNFARGSTNANDLDGHGTHVTGIVTGEGINSITNTYGFTTPNQAKGVADGTAVPDGAGILAGKVCGPLGCYTSDISKGIEWAVANNADIISMSLGGGNFGGHCDGDILAAKANWAVDQGVVVVASAGNDNAGVSTPACGSKVIAVGAVYQSGIGTQDYNPVCEDTTTEAGQRVCFSNYGTALDLMAPGAAVLSSYSCFAAGDCTSSNDYYAWYWGTSQAAPHVAGAAALLLEKNPNLSPADVKNILEQSAVDKGTSGYDTLYGWGIVDPNAAVGYTVNPAASTTTLTSSPNPSTYGQTVTFTAAVSPADATGTVTFRDGLAQLGTATLSSGLATFSTTGLSVGSHSITATYSGDGNYLASTSTTISQEVTDASVPAGDFSLSASPSSQTITPGGSTSYTVYITRIAGFAEPVALSVSGLPAGATGTFSPNPDTSFTLTITTLPTIKTKTYPLTITGTSPSLSHTTTVSLSIRRAK